MLGTLLFLLPMVIKIFKEIQDDVDDQEDPDSSNVDVLDVCVEHPRQWHPRLPDKYA